jgi:hypothetical protein
MEIKTSIRVDGLKDTLIILEAIEGDSVKQLKKDADVAVRSSGVFSAIRSNVPSVAPMSGMMHNGATKWAGITNIKTAIPPITLRRLARKRDTPIISIHATGSPDGLGFDYSELAGIRRHPPRSRSKIPSTGLRGAGRGDGSIAIRGQGDNMIKVLEDKFGKQPGRFAYEATIKKRPALNTALQVVLDKYAAIVNRKLR